MGNIENEMVFVGLTESEALELIAELDHDHNGVSDGFSPLGKIVKDRIEAHMTYIKASITGDDDLINAADATMLELYPDPDSLPVVVTEDKGDVLGYVSEDELRARIGAALGMDPDE